MKLYGVIITLFATSACQNHETVINQPTAEQIKFAVEKFDTWGPNPRPGRWDVSVSNRSVRLDGVDQETKDALIEAGKRFNTQSYCRGKGSRALGIYVQVAMQVAARPGCEIETLEMDPGRLYYRSKCLVGSASITEELEFVVRPDEMTINKTSGWGDRMLPLKYEGRHVGACLGSERPWMMPWTDPSRPSSVTR